MPDSEVRSALVASARETLFWVSVRADDVNAADLH